MAGKIYNSVTWPATADHNHITSYSATGNSSYDCKIQSSSAGSPAHLVDTDAGTNTFSYCTIQDMHVSGGTWDCTDGNSHDVSGNDGWTFLTPVTLTVADEVSAGSCDAVVLTQVHQLAVQDSVSSSVSDSPAVAYAQFVRLIASDYIDAAAATATTAQLTAPSSKTSGTDFQAGLISDDTNPLPSIDLANNKYTELEWAIEVVGGVAQEDDIYQFRVTVGGVPLDTYTVTPQITVGIGQVDLVLSDSVSTSVIDAVVLTQQHVLQASDVVSASTIDALLLSSVHVLSVSDVISAGTIDAVSVTQAHVVSVSNEVSASTADQINLTQQHSLAVPDETSASVSDSIALVQSHTLTASDVISASVVDGISLSGEMTLVTQDAVSSSTADALVLTGTHIIALTDVVSQSTIDALVLDVSGILSLSDVISSTVCDPCTLTQTHVLSTTDAVSASDYDALNLSGINQATVQDTTSASKTDDIDLTQLHVLLMQDVVSASNTDDVVGAEEQPYAYPYDLVSASDIDALVLTQVHNLTVQDVVSGSTTDNTSAATIVLGNVYLILEGHSPSISFHPHSPEVTMEGYGPEITFKGRRNFTS